jgi:hypothetical protein
MRENVDIIDCTQPEWVERLNEEFDYDMLHRFNAAIDHNTAQEKMKRDGAWSVKKKRNQKKRRR